LFTYIFVNTSQKKEKNPIFFWIDCSHYIFISRFIDSKKPGTKLLKSSVGRSNAPPTRFQV